MAKDTNESAVLKKLYVNIEIKKMRLDELAQIMGKKAHPGVVGKKLRIYLDNGSVELRCVGFTIDDDGELIFALEDKMGEPFFYRHKNLIRYELAP
ncbi:MAG: hypothetical protein ACI9DM_002712 [Cyclobacteriaceae bacterium]|jgi:hypothetical protein